MKNKKYLFALPILALAGAGALVGCGGGGEPSSDDLFNVQTLILEKEAGQYKDVSITVDNKKAYVGKNYETKVTLTQTDKAKTLYELPSAEYVTISYGSEGGHQFDLPQDLYTYEIDPSNHKNASIFVDKTVIDYMSKSTPDKALVISFDGKTTTFPDLTYGVTVKGNSPRKDYTIKTSVPSFKPGPTPSYTATITLESQAQGDAGLLELSSDKSQFQILVDGSPTKITDPVTQWKLEDDKTTGTIQLNFDVLTGNIEIIVPLTDVKEAFNFVVIHDSCEEFQGDIALVSDKVVPDATYKAEMVLTQGTSDLTKYYELPSDTDATKALTVTYVPKEPGKQDPTPINFTYSRSDDHTHATFTIEKEALASVVTDEPIKVEVKKLNSLVCEVEPSIIGKEEYTISLDNKEANPGKNYSAKLTINASGKDEKHLPEIYSKENVKIYVNDMQLTSFTEEEIKDLWIYEDEKTANITIPGKYITANLYIKVRLISKQ